MSFNNNNKEEDEAEREQFPDEVITIPNPPSATAATSTTSPPKTLWMGDLDPWADEDSIINLWNSMNKRVLVKLIKAKKGTPAANLNTGHAGYCFVEFETYDDAKNALGLNGSLIPNTNRLFRLNWASGATLFSSIPQSPEFSLFVGDLSPKTTEANLLALFQNHFKSVKTVRVMTDPITGTSRCFGFVRFSDEDDRNKALNEMSGVWCAGRPLRVALATPKSLANSNSNSNSSSSLSTQLHHHHQQQQQQAPLYPQFQNLNPQPYAQQDLLYQQSLPSTSSLQQAAQNEQPQSLSETSSNATTNSNANNNTSANNNTNNMMNDPTNTTVFVGGLSSGVPEHTLAQLFQPFGNIIQVKIPLNKGCGFIKFEKREDAEASISSMQGFQIGGNRIRLSWGRPSTFNVNQYPPQMNRLSLQQQQQQQQFQLQQQFQQPHHHHPQQQHQQLQNPNLYMNSYQMQPAGFYSGPVSSSLGQLPSSGSPQQAPPVAQMPQIPQIPQQQNDSDLHDSSKLQELYRAAAVGKLDSLS